MDQSHGQMMMELMHWKVGGWQAMYIYEPLDRGETDAKQVRDTHQTGAWTMTFNRLSHLDYDSTPSTSRLITHYPVGFV